MLHHQETSGEVRDGSPAARWNSHRAHAVPEPRQSPFISEESCASGRIRKRAAEVPAPLPPALVPALALLVGPRLVLTWTARAAARKPSPRERWRGSVHGPIFPQIQIRCTLNQAASATRIRARAPVIVPATFQMSKLMQRRSRESTRSTESSPIFDRRAQRLRPGGHLLRSNSLPRRAPMRR